MTANITLLMQDLLRFAPTAAINCGAASIRDTPDKPFTYPSKTAFYQEIVWLLWQISLPPEQAQSA